MRYFEPDFLEFFKELAPNNNKDWFDENRKRYVKVVKEPFQLFVKDLITELSKYNPNLKNLEPRDCIFRINRDIRFSKDKTPYKLNISALLAEGGRKNKQSEGCYVELSPEHLRVYGGIYQPDKETLLAIREGIADDMKGFRKVISNEKFVKAFGDIRGDKNKIIPKHLKHAGTEEPLIFNKQYYYFAEFDPEKIISEHLLETVSEMYQVSRPVEQYFSKIINR